MDMTPVKIRKKPVEVEAMQFTQFSATSVMSWCRGILGMTATGLCNSLTIHTLEGDMVARPGDWVIKGIKGEFYPCKPDIFEATYDVIPGDVNYH